MFSILKNPKKSNRGGGGTPIETVVQSSCSSASYRDVHTMPTSQLASYRDMHGRPSASAAQKFTVRANPTAHHWEIQQHTGEKSNCTVYNVHASELLFIRSQHDARWIGPRSSEMAFFIQSPIDFSMIDMNFQSPNEIQDYFKGYDYFSSDLHNFHLIWQNEWWI